MNFRDFLDELCERSESQGVAALPMPERHILAVWEFLVELNNGGLHQYFGNSAGDNFDDLRSGLDAIGCSHERELVESSLVVFGRAGYTPDRTAREAVLFPTDANGEMDDDLFDKHVATITPLNRQLQDRVEHIGRLNDQYARSYANNRNA